MNIDVKRIRSVVAVAKHASFRRAAEALGISQPALSTHVSEVERVVGVSLFSRTTRSVRVTEAGESFVRRVERTLDELDGALLDLKQQATLARGHVSIACIPTVAAHVLPTAIRQFVKKFPAVSVQVYDDVSSALERQVEAGGVDFGIGPVPTAQAALNFQPLVNDRFVAILPRRHPLASRKCIALRELLAFPTVALRPGTHVRAAIERAYRGISRDFRPVLELSNHHTALGMVRAGLGAAILPAMVAQDLHDGTHFAVAEITNPVIRREVGFVFRRGQRFSPAAQALQEILRGLMNWGEAPARIGGNPRMSS